MTRRTSARQGPRLKGTGMKAWSRADFSSLPAQHGDPRAAAERARRVFEQRIDQTDPHADAVADTKRREPVAGTRHVGTAPVLHRGLQPAGDTATRWRACDGRPHADGVPPQRPT